MKYPWFIVGICCCLAFFSVQAGEKDNPLSVQALDVEVVPEGSPARETDGPRTEKPRTRTTVTLRVVSDTPDVIPFEGWITELTVLRDSSGRNLWPSLDSRSLKNIDYFAEVTGPRNTALKLKVGGKGIPAAGSSSITIKGKIKVWAGFNPRSSRQDGVALKPGEKITVGPANFEITDVQRGRPGGARWIGPSSGVRQGRDGMGGGGGNGDGSENMRVKLQYSGNISKNIGKVAGFSFFDPSGERVASRMIPHDSRSGGEDEPGRVTAWIELAKTLKKADVVVEHWEKYGSIRFPFTAEADLLPGTAPDRADDVRKTVQFRKVAKIYIPVEEGPNIPARRAYRSAVLRMPHAYVLERSGRVYTFTLPQQGWALLRRTHAKGVLFRHPDNGAG